MGKRRYPGPQRLGGSSGVRLGMAAVMAARSEIAPYLSARGHSPKRTYFKKIHNIL
jgi:hypothetical protein